MCVYMYICTCIHIYIHTYIHTYMQFPLLGNSVLTARRCNAVSTTPHRSANHTTPLSAVNPAAPPHAGVLVPLIAVTVTPPSPPPAADLDLIGVARTVVGNDGMFHLLWSLGRASMSRSSSPLYIKRICQWDVFVCGGACGQQGLYASVRVCACVCARAHVYRTHRQIVHTQRF